MAKTLSSKFVESFLIRTNDPNRKLWLHRFLVLLLTFIVYTIYHMSRKPMSVVKSRLFNGNVTDHQNNWPPFDGSNANTFLSILDGAYWGTYAIGMFFTGFLAERSNLRYFLSISLSICGLLCIVSGSAFYLKIHSLWFFIITQVLTGLAESTGWPAVLAIMGGWFGSTKKGFIFGIWSLHTSVGNMLGTTIAGIFVDFNWGLSFIVPGLLCIIISIVIFFLLVEKPSDVDLIVNMTLPDDNRQMKLSDEESITNTVSTISLSSTIDSKIVKNSSSSSSSSLSTKKSESNSLKSSSSSTTSSEPIGIWDALFIPGVIEFSICLFFTKSVSYIFLTWLPKFISTTNRIPASESAYISIMFDIGGSVGSIMAGLMSDIINAGGITCIIFLLMAIPSLFLLAHFSSISLAINLALQFMAGFFINGPYSLIITSVSANLACTVPSKAATATISAIIDGTGSIGAAIGPAITGPLSDYFTWNSVFYLCMVGDFIAACCLVRVAWNEWKRNHCSILKRCNSSISNDDYLSSSIQSDEKQIVS
ncbi:glucose-6-phosphate exchanger SLC37A2-like [Dermatophagoides pteronyssinus]|uniref:glucose-6-phosphate exchanger SLC37A2-like n=1 Tax=Dermatophagoides pteronyssinus TaxID=6956 RepID=UPI003F66A0D7